ncbi:hypothetical protein [Acinetobacter baumannii]|uniref:hypothetical protein n=1 Tax=Acinetobacter baumannii TaxID=470 RepID=UPI00234150F2|nr:hypothetical protein [Acinetobacter baumannii]MDC5019290.1 hypothetical protein [Acinetobacter baumannii]MDE5409358.1 hypothetical protein [Acinetobacter baumannii]MDV7589355.1 hypothetical protein [Acinetobacter baumannii]HCA5151334.1 hypothetical protein [Acinetobacter baumannii]
MKLNNNLKDFQISDENSSAGAHLIKSRIKEKEVESTIDSTISKKIGRGEDAKNSIIWTIITWCLIIPSIITFLYFITMWVVILANHPDNSEHVLQIRENILKIWGLFSPIITLALGYLYGSRSSENK